MSAFDFPQIRRSIGDFPETKKSFDHFVVKYLTDLVDKSDFECFQEICHSYDNTIFDTVIFEDDRFNLSYYVCNFSRDVRFLNCLFENKGIVEERESLFLTCCVKKKLDFCEIFLKCGWSPNKQEYHVRCGLITPFNYCVSHGFVEFVEMMLIWKANPTIKSKRTDMRNPRLSPRPRGGENSFEIACKHQRPEVLGLLIKSGYVFNINNLIFSCINYDSIRCLEILVTDNNINNRNFNSDTLLSRSMFIGNTNISKMLLKKGADPNKVNKFKKISLEYFNFNSIDSDLLGLLLDKQKNMNTIRKNILILNLSKMIERIGNTIVGNKMCRRFIEIFPDSIKLSNIEFPNPFFSAVLFGNIELINFIVNKGLNINIVNGSNENTLLIYIKHSFDIDITIIDFLLRKYINPNTVSTEGEKCINLALERNNINLVLKLLSYGAFLCISDICTRCDTTYLDHLLEPSQKKNILADSSKHHLALCLEKKNFNTFKFNINNPCNYYNYAEIRQVKNNIERENNIAVKLLRDFSMPWGISTNYLYSKENRDLVNLMLHIQQRKKSSLYNYDIFIHILEQSIVFDSKKLIDYV